MTFRFRCPRKFIMANASRRNCLLRLLGLLFIASLFTSYLMYVRVNADVQGARVIRKQTLRDVNMARTSSVQKISKRREDLMASQQRFRSSRSPFVHRDSRITNNREQTEGNGNVAGLAPVKKSRLSVIRRVFRDKRADRTIHRVGNSNMANTSTDARKYSENLRLMRDQNVGIERNTTKSVTFASGEESVVNNLSSAMLGSFRGDTRRPIQKPLESKQVKPGSTRNGNASSIHEYVLKHNTSAKRTGRIGKQLEDGSNTSSYVSKPTSTPHEPGNSSVMDGSLRVNNDGQKAINKRTEDGRADISKTAIESVNRLKSAPHNKSQVVVDASRRVIDTRPNISKQAIESSKMTAVRIEKKASASLRVSPLGLGREVVNIGRESVKQKFGQVDRIYAPESVTSYKANLIIAAQPRTGSSFLGDAFNQHPDVFFLFEPLRGIVHSPLQHLKDPKPMQFLAGILHCKFSQQTYIKHIQNFRRFSSNALSSPPLCAKKTFLDTPRKKCDSLNTVNMEAVCKSNYNVTVMKILTSRIPNGTVKSLFPLCDSTNCTIIYLVRDPRPVVFSQMKVGIQSWQNFKIRGANDTAPRPSIQMYSASVCQQIEANVKTLKNLTGRMKSRYHILRYEDLAGNATETLRRVYKMVGLKMVNSTLEWIELHTTGKRGSSKRDSHHYNFSTRRNSKAAIDNWRLEIDPCVVHIIERSCRSVLKLLGYKPLNGSEQMQYNLNVSLTDGE